MIDDDMQKLEAAEWCVRCAQRLADLDDAIVPEEALEMAKDLFEFERTRAMAPERAADFVAAEMANADRKPFERRAVDRVTSPPSLAPRRAS